MLTLTRGDDSLIVAPEAGGAMLGWTRGGVHLLRHPSPEAALHLRPGDMGGFPLVPYCNRIAYRRFAWEGKSYELAANFGDHPHAIHGLGWQSPWQVDAVADDAVTLSLRHDPEGDARHAWPFPFAARLEYRLAEAGLTISLAAVNLHTGPVPMGIGIHPYFPRSVGARIAFQAAGAWITHDALPIARVAIPAAWDHASGRPADQTPPLDNCFTGWQGTAPVDSGPASIRIEADAVFGNLQVFTPSGAGFLCVEPVSHIPDAINRSGLTAAEAMTAVPSGGILSGSVRFLVNVPSG